MPLENARSARSAAASALLADFSASDAAAAARSAAASARVTAAFIRSTSACAAQPVTSPADDSNTPPARISLAYFFVCIISQPSLGQTATPSRRGFGDLLRRGQGITYSGRVK